MNAGIAPITEMFENNFERGEARRLLEPCRVFFDYADKGNFPLLSADQFSASDTALLQKITGAKDVFWLSYRDVENGTYRQLPKPQWGECLWQTVALADVLTRLETSDELFEALERTHIEDALGRLLERQYAALENFTWEDKFESEGILWLSDIESVCTWIMHEYLEAAFAKHESQHEIRQLLLLCSKCIPLYTTDRKKLYVLTA